MHIHLYCLDSWPYYTNIIQNITFKLEDFFNVDGEYLLYDPSNKKLFKDMFYDYNVNRYVINGRLYKLSHVINTGGKVKYYLKRSPITEDDSYEWDTFDEFE